MSGIERMESLKCLAYTPALFDSLEHYMQTIAPVNNRTPKALRLDEYDDQRGQLLLIVDSRGKIRATCSVVSEMHPERNFRYAKTFGRLHIDQGISHRVIDRYFEPRMYSWLEDKGIEHVYFTVNEGHERVLEWACRRHGDRRGARYHNRDNPGVGLGIRQNSAPHSALIFERHVWQYCIYFAPDGQFFLKREERPLPPRAEYIFRKEFPRATRNWDGLSHHSEIATEQASAPHGGAS